MTMARRVYRRPPIAEALCEFVFASSQDWDLLFVAQLREALKTTYPSKPRRQSILEAEIQQEIQEGETAFRLKQSPGKVQFPSEDGKQLVGVGQDQISVHVMSPYPGWENFRSKILEALDAYRRIAEPTGIKRIGLRYINKIELPGDKPIDLNTFFVSAPSFPDGFQGQMVNFVSRREFVYNDTPIKMLLTFASMQAATGKFNFLLDLDMIWEQREEPLSLDRAIEMVDDLRARERDAFEFLITDRTREVFDVK